MLEKRVLLLANNPLSDTNSNGRTLKNFFFPEDRERLAQFYIQGKKTAHDTCASFFRVSDGEVFRAFFFRKEVGSVVLPSAADAAPSPNGNAHRIKRTPLTMLLRNFFWNRRAWRDRFDAWVEAFSPEIVLLQAGDSPFMYRLAVELSQKRSIPLVIYNSEDYYFKRHNFMRSRGISSIFFPLFMQKLRKALRKAIDQASISVYITEDLKDTYDAEFSSKSTYIYTATEVVPQAGTAAEGTFSYLGNLGLNRHLGLIRIAEALQRISPEYTLDVYGRAPSEEVERALTECAAIRYRGLVDYPTVRRVMGDSTLLFHAESFEEFYRRDIRHGFSTKIADSLASGSCFVIFAPPELSCTKYLKENECACVIDNEAELEDKLREVIGDRALRERYIARAIAVAEENHNARKNREKMVNIINNLKAEEKA